MRRFLQITPAVTVHLTPHTPKTPSPKKLFTIRDPLHGITNIPQITPTSPETEPPTEADGPPAKARGNFPVSPPKSLGSSPLASDYDTDAPHTPGPFLRIRRIQEGSHGKTEAVRDMERGVRGRVLCVKIFDRTTKSLALQQELDAYRALSRATTRYGDNWLPFVMRLEASLEESARTFFVMDVMRADLEDVLSEWDCELRNIHTKQWVAQMATALAAIHDAGIIHRDLKPENIFIDFRFNIRIGDFGCAFIEPQGKPIYRFGGYCREVCGTWPYTAPEMVDNAGKRMDHRKDYSLDIDYWALGCIIFELEREGHGSLFETPTELAAYRRYQPLRHHGRSYFAFANLKSDAESLISGLLRPRPAHRYGYHEVRCHEYFKGPNGYNEFDNIEERGRAINDLPVGGDIPGGHFQADDQPSVIYCPSVIDADHRSDNNTCWINPHGIWGTENHEII